MNYNVFGGTLNHAQLNQPAVADEPARRAVYGVFCTQRCKWTLVWYTGLAQRRAVKNWMTTNVKLDWHEL